MNQECHSLSATVVRHSAMCRGAWIPSPGKNAVSRYGLTKPKDFSLIEINCEDHLIAAETVTKPLIHRNLGLGLVS